MRSGIAKNGPCHRDGLSSVLFQFRIPQASDRTPSALIAAETMQTVVHPDSVHNIPPVSAPLTRPRAPAAYNPAIMVATGDHDDRVVPAHSFKYAATLQEKYTGSNPVLIRINTDAGHGAGKPTDKVIAEYSDTWSFIMYNMDFQPDFE